MPKLVIKKHLFLLMFLFKLSCRTGVEIYILIGSHVQPLYQKVQHQYMRVYPNLGNTIYWPKRTRYQL